VETEPPLIQANRTAKMSSNEEILAMIENLEGQVKALKKALKAGLPKGARKSKAKKAEVDSDGEPVEKAKRPLNAWQAWTKHVLTEYAEEYEAFAAEQESRRGVAIKFAKHCRETKGKEHSAFEAAFVPAERAAEPKEKKEKAKKPAKKAVGGAGAPAPLSDADSDADSDAEAKAVAKALRKEEKAAKKAAKAAKKAKESDAESEVEAEKPAKKVVASAAAPAPKPAPKPAEPESDSDSDAELTLKKWVFRGKTYYRSDDNDCWLANDDGSMGAWAGKYDPVTDKIDEDAPEPEHD
jgi:hypothetical protein